MMVSNLRELAKDVLRERSPRKILFRWRAYRRMKHYFG